MSLAGAHCQLLVVKMASTLWANIILKRRDAVLAKVKDSMSFESMDLRNSVLSPWAGSASLMMFFSRLWRRRRRSSMMKLAARPCCGTSLLAGRKSCSFPLTSCKSQGPPLKKSTGSSAGSSSRQVAPWSSSSKTTTSFCRGRGKKF